jgi:hypothetical protein
MKRGKNGDEKVKDRPMPNRKMLTAYLQYAVDDIAVLNETSATLVRLAIEHLKRSSQSSSQR